MNLAWKTILQGAVVLRGVGKLLISSSAIGCIDGDADKQLGTTLENAGQLNYSGSGLRFGPNSEAGKIFNLPGKMLSFSGCGDIEIAAGNPNHIVSNQGTFVRYGSGESRIDVPVANSGSIVVQQGALNFNGGGSVNFFEQNLLSELPGSTIRLSSSVTGDTTNADRFSPIGTVTLAGGSLSAPNTFEVMGADREANSNGYDRNFAYGTIRLDNAYIKLVNAFGAVAQALYIDTLVVPVDSTLDLNGIKVYTRALQISGTVIGGEVTPVPDGGSLQLSAPTFGTISVVGEADDWAFFGRAGQRVALTVNPGSMTLPAPISPLLGFAQIQLISPNGTVLVTASNAISGELATLNFDALPVDGNYLIRVKAPTAQSASTGNYLLTGINATIDSSSLVLNQQSVGLIENSRSIDRWTFSGQANQQIRLDFINAAFSGVRFKITGPNGWTGFTDVSDDSSLVTLPTNGTYQVEVTSNGAGFGSYAFRLEQTSQIALNLGSAGSALFSGPGFAQLYSVDVTAGSPLTVVLESLSAAGAEVYARLGSAPTRQSFDYQGTSFGNTQSLLVPFATTGKWYVLVYANSIPAGTAYTLRTDATPVVVSHVTPAGSVNNPSTTITIQGAGFVSGSTVELIAPNGTATVAQSIDIDSSTRMTTSFNLSGLATGTYGLRVTVPGGASSTLSASFQVLPAGQGKLETKLILPPALGRSANATIYVEYANTGSAAMPAPLLTLQSADLDNSDRPWMTLDSSRLIAGFWTDAQPDGFAHSVQIYASGATPGFLQPGERIQIPVYYVGLQQPYNLSDGTVELEILINDVETTTPFDWAGLRDFLRPNWISPEAWPAVYANLQLAVGSTWGDYVRMLGDNATYLARLGENVTDASELYSFELQQALANSPVGVLAGAVDAAVAVPGVSLSFSRYFATNLAQRSETGSFGRGWIAPWQTAIKIENEGIVVVSDAAGSQRRFQPDRRFLYGTYFSAAGDYGTLHRDGSGAFTLTEVTGEVAHFRADGFLEYVEDADHNRVTLDYTSGRLTQLTHSNGATLAIAYNSAGHIGSITDSAGRVATYVYDLSNNYLLSVNTVAGTTNYSYNMTGASAQIGTLATISDSTGVTQSFAYDNHGRLIDTFTGANLNRFDFAYDSAGGISTTDPSGAVSQIFVDHRGLVVRSESSNGYYENYTYDGKRQLMQIADALGRTTRYGYASQGAVVSVTDVLGLTTKFLPGGTNNAPSTFVDGNGNITRYDYSGKGLSKTTYPNGTVERISYDGQGDVLSFTNRRGESIFRTYNTAGQLTSEQFLDGTQNTYTYDSLNRLKTIVDPTGTTSFTYDAHDRITRIASPQGRWLEYEYDSANRRTKMTDQLGVVTRYVYDSIGRLSELRDTANAIVIKYTYDSAGRLSREDKGNGTYTINTYDVFSRIVSIYHYAPDGSVNSKFVYGYDLLGRRTSMETSDGSWSYTYDLSGQLTRATFASTNMLIPNQDLNYEYDALGNRVRTVLNGVETGYVTNSMNQYVSAGGVTFKYDLDGNLIEESGPDGTTLYTYNALSQLTQVVSPDGTTNYTYDGLGNRKSVVTNGTETQFVWDPFGLSNVVAEYNGQGSQTSWFVNGYGLESAQSVNGRAYYDFDAIGSTNGLSNESGAYVNKYAYDPYGNEILSTESIANQNEFVGQSGVANDGSGLYYMRARYYIGEFGRFDSQDPIRLLGGDFNQYRYGHNDPANQADPLGLFTIDVGLSGGLGLGGTVGIVVDSAGGAGVYVGIGATTPGVGGSVNIGGGNVSNGGSVQIQGGIGGGVGVAGSGSVGSDGSVGGSVGVGVGAGGSKVTGIGGYIVYTVPVPAGKIFNWLFPPGGPSGQGGDGTPAAKPVPIPTPPAGKKGDSGSRNNVVSRDPNEKFGASGYGPAAFIPADSVIPYRINFENLGPGTVPAPTQPATAPAQRIEVTDQLSNTLDWATFTFTEFGFGDTVVSLSESIKHAFETVPVTYNDQTFDVQVELDFDSITGLMRVVFQSVDPLTELPPDVLTGFLPPEDGTGRGKGHLAYSIEVEPGLATGTEIRNIASIIFDGQTAIATNQIDPQDPVAGTSPAKEALNTIDAAAPSSSVNALAATVSSTFTVNWTGVDDAGGSGIAFYDIYVAIDGGSYALWLDDAVGTSASCTGSVGHTYHFYSVATDNVGHSESAPAAADAQTRTDSSNQSPQILDAVFSLPENSGLNTVVGIPNSIDPDAADVLTYNIISGNVAGAFVINPATGAISVANPALLNFETTPSFALTVQVTDNHGAADTASVSVNLTNVNEAPTDIGLSANNIAENNTANSTVGILSATDVDGGSSFTYSLVAGAGSTDNSSFTIVGDTLKITPSADFETKGSYAIRVRVSDQGGQTVEKPFTISITDLNESPTISSIVNLSMPENGAPSVVNFVIGDAETPAGSLTVSATSSNASLIPNANLIVGGAGANRSLTISPTANQSGSTTITVTVSDGLRSSIQTFQVTVQPVGNTPAIGLNRLPLVRVSAKKVEAIDGSATLTGIDGPVLTFNGAVVTVSGQSAKDALSILKQNGIARKGKNVVFGKTIIGSISGGKKGAGLTINLNASASQSSVQALLRSVGFKSTDKVGGHRTIKMQITNLGGLSTNQATRQIQIGL